MIPPVLAGAAHIGLSTSPLSWQAIGTILLLDTAPYVIPRTAFLGAVIVTRQLGCAICSHVRVRGDILAPTIISLLVAVVMWADPVWRTRG